MAVEKNVKNGLVWLQDMKSYECHHISLTGTGFSVSHMVDEEGSRYSEDGPNFVLAPITSGLIRDLLFSRMFEAFDSEKFEFSGPILGRVRAYSGYHAAANGGDSRPIETIAMNISFSEVGLIVGIKGQAGHIFENDCSSKDKQFITRRYSIDFQVAVENIPPLIDVRSAKNIFERKYLGTNEAVKIYPKL